MWKQLDISSDMTERVESFSLPVENRVLVFDPDDALYVVDIIPPYNVFEQTRRNAKATIKQYRASFLNPCTSGEHEVIKHIGNVCKHEIRVQFKNKWYSLLGLMGGKPLMANKKGEELILTLGKGEKNSASYFTITKEGRFQPTNKLCSMLDLIRGKPIVKNQYEEELRLAQIKREIDDYFKVAHDSSFTVVKEGKEVFKYDFKDFSGDWTYVTFSEDDNYILLGNPYEFSIFERS